MLCSPNCMQMMFRPTSIVAPLMLPRLPGIAMEALGTWMSSTRLRLNSFKTKFSWLGTRQQRAKLDMVALAADFPHFIFSSVVRDPGPGTYFCSSPKLTQPFLLLSTPPIAHCCPLPYSHCYCYSCPQFRRFQA